MEWILVVILTTGDVDTTWNLVNKTQCENLARAEKEKESSLYKEHRCFAVNEEGGYE